MDLNENNSDEKYLFRINFKDEIPDDHICHFIAEFVGAIDFSRIDYEHEIDPDNMYYPAAMLVRIILMGYIFEIYSSRQLERLVCRNVILMYLAGLKKPTYSEIATFKREHEDLLGVLLLEVINQFPNQNLINFNRIKIDDDNFKAEEYNVPNLTDEEVTKVLYLVHKSILIDEKEDKDPINRYKIHIPYTKDQIREYIKESEVLKLKKE